MSTPTVPSDAGAGAVLGYYVRCPVLVVMGTLDSAGPRAGGSAIVDILRPASAAFR